MEVHVSSILECVLYFTFLDSENQEKVEMWVNSQRDGRPAEYR